LEALPKKDVVLLPVCSFYHFNSNIGNRHHNNNRKTINTNNIFLLGVLYLVCNRSCCIDPKIIKRTYSGGWYMDWVITIPKTIKWEDYQKEIDAVKDGRRAMRYRLPFRINANKGDRCFVVWNGKVRGWMEIIRSFSSPNMFVCGTTGKAWPPGYYLERSGPFHSVDGPEMKGFRGVRRF
jgi:hypothetical protein